MPFVKINGLEVELAVFPRCGHNIHEHYPEQYAHQVLNFLDRCKSKEEIA